MPINSLLRVNLPVSLVEEDAWLSAKPNARKRSKSGLVGFKDNRVERASEDSVNIKIKRGHISCYTKRLSCS